MAADSERIDGAAIAAERIAREAVERTGSLDLGRLGLTALPEALFALKHLRVLNLGLGIVDEDGEWRKSSADIGPNAIESSLGRLIDLPELEAVSLCYCKLTNLGGIAGFNWLRTLDCSDTEVSDLAPLAGLTALQELNCSKTQVSSLEPLAKLPELGLLGLLLDSG